MSDGEGEAVTDEGLADDPSDSDVLDALSRLGAADPPPAELYEAGRALWAWRTIDAELAELTYDSEDHDDALVGVRGDGPRQLAFEGASLAVRLEVLSGPPAELIGQLLPPVEASITVRWPDAAVEVHADGHGRFRLSGLRSGPVSLRCEAAGGVPGAVQTAWVTL
jgi:hypothetical protein